MKASRKDFEAIAELIYQERGNWYKDVAGFKAFVNSMADIFAKANPAFNRSKFIDWCEGGKYDQR